MVNVTRNQLVTEIKVGIEGEEKDLVSDGDFITRGSSCSTTVLDLVSGTGGASDTTQLWVPL